MEQREIVVERVFDAPIEKVWHAWTDAEMIKHWWGPANFTAPLVRNDFHVGGTYLYCMRGSAGPGVPAQDYYSTGTYKEIVPMERIVATDSFADADGNIINAKDVGMPGEWPLEMLVTVTFEDTGDGKTKLTVRHAGHPKEMEFNATMGWKQSLDKLAAALAS